GLRVHPRRTRVRHRTGRRAAWHDDDLVRRPRLRRHPPLARLRARAAAGEHDVGARGYITSVTPLAGLRSDGGPILRAGGVDGALRVEVWTGSAWEPTRRSVAD